MHYHSIFHIQNSIDTKFQLKLTILNFWTKLTQNENDHRILHIQISVGSTFQQTIFIFWNKFPQKRILPFENRKNKHHH